MNLSNFFEFCLLWSFKVLVMGSDIDGVENGVKWIWCLEFVEEVLLSFFLVIEKSVVV